MTLKKDFQFEDVTLAYSVSGNLNILLNPDTADKLFFGSRYSLNDVIEMHNNQRIISFDLNTKDEVQRCI
ncbi:MAG: hypothetical protein MZV64_45500 [Ignavibacteriales bacterium]|nr:hypothetical protein [Ignavibacteriales bacterium]